MTKKNKTPTPWEIAKPILEQDYLSGFVTEKMARGKLHKMRPEYEAVPINSFGNNWLRMKETYRNLKARTSIEQRALEHDRSIYPKTPGRWDGSEAQRLMKKDVKIGRHKLYKKPADFWLCREEYQKFSLKKFRDHVWQEVRQDLGSNYWLSKKWKKAEAQRQAEEAENKEEHFFAAE